MLFTSGKTRFYEKMMQEVPNFHKGSVHGVKYKFSDIDCLYCCERKSCKNKLCPYIMENLKGLAYDNDFLNAVENADSCKTAQKKTLIMLKKRGFGDSKGLSKN